MMDDGFFAQVEEHWRRAEAMDVGLEDRSNIH